MLKGDVLSLGDSNFAFFDKIKFFWLFTFLVDDMAFCVLNFFHVFEKRFKMHQLDFLEEVIIFEIYYFLVGLVVMIHPDDFVIGLVGKASKMSVFSANDRC